MVDQNSISHQTTGIIPAQKGKFSPISSEKNDESIYKRKNKHFQIHLGMVDVINFYLFLVKEEVSQGPAFLYLEEEDVQDPVDVIQRAMSATIDQVHWTQHQPLACDSAAWLNSETLLPRLTIENLSKWTLYKEQDIAKPPRSKAPRERWEAEDVTEDILEFDVTRKQVGQSHIS